MRDCSENQVTLALIRHGATPANREGRYLGRTDEALSEEGREALLAYKARRYYPEADCLFVSPMRRCMETARLLYPRLVPTVIPEWREIDFGRFEYGNYEELKSEPAYQAWVDSGGTLDFPEGESRRAFMLRCAAGLERMRGELRGRTQAHADAPVRAGAIVHGGTIMALLSAPDGERYFDYQVPNGRGYLCRLENEGIKVVAKL
ncbi:MAG: histidine phosphatase family protein [Roseburia sp.]|nr:histidine phosphatase family protein [Roseburia sp.]